MIVPQATHLIARRTMIARPRRRAGRPRKSLADPGNLWRRERHLPLMASLHAATGECGMNRFPHGRPGFVAACALLLAACTGSSAPDSTASSSGADTAAGGYTVTALVSDGKVPAPNSDAPLVNPWGIVFNPIGPVWIADNGSNSSTLYAGQGTKFPLNVAIPAGANGPAAPTGIVYNGGGGFNVSNGLLSGSAQFIFDGEGGTITGWSMLVNTTNAILVYNDGAGGAVYKGLALASNNGAAFLYATDFHNGKIDVFDSGFNKQPANGAFTDPNLPSGYAPFGIQAIGGLLYVSYAMQKEPDRHDEADGPGLGLVDVYDASGKLQRRLATGGPLDAPWGLALAPAGFGQFSNALLVGNFGDGRIHAFNPDSGALLGSLGDSGGKAIVIDGLWGLAFGNGVFDQPANALFFTAGSNDEADGLYGRIDPP
jgi:uncharacterized protein (TIGR03118 family)